MLYDADFLDLDSFSVKEYNNVVGDQTDNIH